MNPRHIVFYFKRGKWHITSRGTVVPANKWWDAVNYVKCMNAKLRRECK